jgi:excisionase family DNA binding protein
MALPDTLPTLLNADQVAEYLGLHKVTVLRFAREGKLPGLKVGREWRFRADDMRAWLEARLAARALLVARFREMADRAQAEGKATGIGPEDVARVIEEVRAERRASTGA